MRTQRGTGKSTAIRNMAAQFGRDSLLVVRDTTRKPPSPACRVLTFDEAFCRERTDGLNPSIVLVDDADDFLRLAQDERTSRQAAESKLATALDGMAKLRDEIAARFDAGVTAVDSELLIADLDTLLATLKEKGTGR
jgi:hypothetical protein